MCACKAKEQGGRLVLRPDAACCGVRGRAGGGSPPGTMADAVAPGTTDSKPHGDVIEVETWTRWDAHLKSSSALLAFLRNSVALQLVLAVAAAAAAALAFAALQQGVLP